MSTPGISCTMEEWIDNSDGSWTDPSDGTIYDGNDNVVGFENGDGSWTDGNGQDFTWDNRPINDGGYFQNDDGTWTSFYTGETISGSGDLGGSSGAVATELDGTVGINQYGDAAWLFDTDASGNQIYQCVGADGVYYMVYDAAGNLLGAVDDAGNLIRDTQADNSAGKGFWDSVKNTAGGLGNGGVSSPAQQLINAAAQALKTAMGTGAAPSQLSALRAQLAQQVAAAKGSGTNPYLIAGAIGLGLLAFSRARAA